MHHAAHVTLVIFVRTEDIEIFQSNDAIQKSISPGISIKEIFRKSIGIQMAQMVKIGIDITHAHRSVAVGGC